MKAYLWVYKSRFMMWKERKSPIDKEITLTWWQYLSYSVLQRVWIKWQDKLYDMYFKREEQC